MSYQTVYICDRCGSESREAEHITVKVRVPVPHGHLSRTDPSCFEREDAELCKDCHQQFNYWWKNEKMP